MNERNTKGMRLESFKKIFFPVLFFIVTLLFLNGLLSLFDLEKYDKEFAPKSTYSIFVAGEGDKSDYYVTNPYFRGAINDQAFRKVKPPGVKRIFVVGGSAAYAWPYKDQYGFTGYLRRVLHQFGPGEFEIINAAGMSYGSHRVLDVLRDVVLFDPDLVLILSGNNEYVEKNVLPTIQQKGGRLTRLSAVIDNTSLYRAARLVLYKSVPSVFKREGYKDLTDIRSAPNVTRGDLGRSEELDREVLANYSHNISEMIETLVQGGIQGVLCTVPSNVVGYRPQSSPLRFQVEQDSARWNTLEDQVRQAYKNIGQADGLAQYARIRDLSIQKLRLQPDEQQTLYDLGQALYGLDQFEDAYGVLVKAKDLDASPVRALSSFNDYLRSQEGLHTGISLADLEELVAMEIRRGFSSGIFLDYCHFTGAGHKFTATYLLQFMDAILKANLPIEQMAKAIYYDDWAQKQNDPEVLSYEYYAKGLTFDNNGNDNEAEKAFLKALEISPFTEGLFVSALYDYLAWIYKRKGDEERFRKMLFKALDAYSGRNSVLISVGNIYVDEGRLDEADKLFRSAISNNTYAPGAYLGLGNIASKRGQWKRAIDYFEKVLHMGRENIWLHKELGRAYLSIGETDKAILSFEAALAINQSDTESLKLLSEARAKK